ncbi:MAG: hypothetical protein K9L74_05685 [Candidatus Izimaplasma sp.]|nr:hypothetical protein [Candidatus Izimaplasma bacterium]
MKFEKPSVVEKLIDNYYKTKVYPITIIKLMLNRRRIMSYMEKAASNDFKIRGEKFKLDDSDCKFCEQKRKEGVAKYCRQHTSVQRVMNANKVLFDEDTGCYIYKNEIFRVVNNRLVIIYCPHTKPISGKITDESVRKITPLTIEDEDFNGLPDYETVSVLSSTWMNDNFKCWFNDEFSIITIPNDRNKSDFVLTCNQ